MPMFTMPERSFMTPHSAPRAIGVARPSTMGAMPGVISITYPMNWKSTPTTGMPYTISIREAWASRCRTTW